jgi:Flp pilus assembly protein TadG
MPGLTRSGRGGALRRLRDEDGAVAVIVAITMVVVLGMAALVVDIGGVESRKAQLQNAADAAALAIAQECAASLASTISACDPALNATAPADALALARGNVNDRAVQVDTVGFAGPDVTVTVSSVQDDVFARVLGQTRTAVSATATARWAPAATPLPLTYNACEFPAPSDQTVLLRSDPLALFQGNCGLLTGVLNAVVPAWMVDGTQDCAFDVNLVTVVTGTLSAVIPDACQTRIQSLVGHRILLPVYEHPLTGVLLQCVVGGLLGSLLTGAASNSDCVIEKYAVVDLTGYDFQSVDANVLLNIPLALQLALGVQVGFADMPGQPNCATINASLGAVVNAVVGMPLCQGIQGQFRGFVSIADAAALQKGDVTLVA